MKKFTMYLVIALFLGGGLGILIWNAIYGGDEKTAANSAEVTMVDSLGANTTVENLIKTDAKYFENMAGKTTFYESQVVLDKPFNEGDHFVAVEVTNIFQQNFDDGKGEVTSNVYEFKHIANYGETQVIVHKGTFVLEDKPVVMDSLKLTFDEAYTKAKQSDLTPSKSHYMLLRNPLGPVDCGPCYVIGNPHFGMMFVGAVDGKVSDKNPAMPEK